ncbi:MAG: hypothetical protein Q4G63_04160 [Bacteroidia bacterium]|nr:hypothetical protein [Bacteroidia bacterium]
MLLTKNKVKEQIELFPDEFSLDLLVERLILLQKIENGIEQSDNNDVIAEGELDKEIEEWFK